MRKYRCNRILEDRKISWRLCAPFFFPLSRENGRGQRKVELSAPSFRNRASKIFISDDSWIQREGTGASFEFQRCFCSKKDTRPPPESLRSRNYSKTIPPPRCESEKTSIARRGIPGKRDAISIHRAQSSRSPHDRPYCIGVRASAYINKRSVHRGVSRGTKYNIVLSDRPP